MAIPQFSFAPSLMPDEDADTRTVRWVIVAVAAALFTVAVSYAAYRTWVGPVVVLDTVGTLRTGSTHSWKLPAGSYEISVDANRALDFSVPGSHCASGRGRTHYVETCELAIAATLAVHKDAGDGKAVTYAVTARRLQHGGR